MANTPKCLYLDSPSTTIGTAYTVPVGTSTILKNILIHNTTGVQKNITIHIVPNGIASQSKTKIIDTPINPKDTVVFDLSNVLHAGYTIQLLQETVGALNVHISGVEVA